MKPAKKPASNAPRKPEPFDALNAPPTKPAAKPGRSAIDIEIKPAKTGNINPNDAPPIPINVAASGVILPKLPRSSGGKLFKSTDAPSIKNEIAIKIPPPITNGNMCETPFIKCL